MTGAEPAVRFEDARLRRGDFEVRFDLAVAPGTWLAVIGPSGAGKTTLLDMAAGFAEPDAGRVLIGGRDMAGVPPSERPVSMVFQENNLFPGLDVVRNVALGLAPRLRVGRETRVRVEAMLEAVGLAGKGARRPHELSGGERGRVALARAFLRERPILALDEPFAALGPALRAEMLGLLAALHAREAGPARKTILMVTHHPEDAVAHAERVAFVDGGRVRLEGPARAVLSARNDEALDRYLGPRRPEM